MMGRLCLPFNEAVAYIAATARGRGSVILLYLNMHARSYGVPRPTAYEEFKVRTFRAGF
jgi:hypothetical protein